MDETLAAILVAVKQVAPFFVVKSEVVPFFVVKWSSNLIGIATLKGNNCPESDEKLVPNIIDKHRQF